MNASFTAAVLLSSAAALVPATATTVTQQAFTFTVDGQTVVGALFRPAQVPADSRLPAIIVDGPWTQVKEQVGYAYARHLAQQGFAVLAFDHRNFGESGGQPRGFEDPALKVADLRAALTALQRTAGVDGDRLFALGVCYGASLVMDIARSETRLRGVATVAAWMHDEAALRAIYTNDGYDLRMRTGERALQAFRANGTVEYIPAFGNDVPLAAMMGPLDYYASPERGAIPAWDNRFASMSFVGWMKHEAVTYAPQVKQPVLMIHSDGSALPDSVKRFHAQLPHPGKKLIWSSGNHLDFYDQPELVVPAAREVAAFFSNL